MFKKRPPTVVRVQGSPMATTVVKTVPDGNKINSTTVNVNCCDHYPVLPDVDEFSLEKQLNSGIDLKEVNSVIFHNESLTSDNESTINKIITENATTTD